MPVSTRMPVRSGLVSVCVLVGMLAMSAPAFADIAPSVTINPVSTFTATTAQLSGTVNPSGGPSATAWIFEYAKDPETEGWTPAYGGEFTGAEAAGTSPIAVPTTLTTLEGLLPGTTYQVRLVATNAGGETVSAEPNPSFTTPAVPPTIVAESTSTTEVTGTSAVLGAEINPGGGETTYRFEYGASSVSENHTSESTLTGSDDNPHPGSILVQGLQPGVVYHYRVVATNASAPGGIEGPEATFTTSATGGEFKLLDDRAWEQVSPVDKYGSRIEAINWESGLIQAAEDGSAITYVAAAPVVPNPEGNNALGESQILSSRGSSGGWSTRDITAPREIATILPPLQHYGEYVVFSPDLSRGVIERYGSAHQEKPLSPLVKEGEKTDYVREGLREAGSAEYLPLFNVLFLGASRNLEYVVVNGLQEWTRATGVLTPLAIRPDGTPPAREPSLGGKGNADARNAVSDDGARVFWSVAENIEGFEYRRLYVRDVAEDKTVRLDLPNQGVVAPEASPYGNFYGARYQYATPDGRKVFFTDDQRLTSNSTAELDTPELYEYDFSKPVGERLTDLTPDLTPASGGAESPSMNVIGNVNVSENGEYVYYVTNTLLTGGEPEDCLTSCDLYVAHVEGPKVTTGLVAVLSGEDEHDWENAPGSGSKEVDLGGVTSRVSPNGRYLAFMSSRGLTGYDNHDAVSGAADEEVFVYDALTNRLACASCDPSGARPHGVLDQEHAGEGIGLRVDRNQLWSNRWLAGSVPGWTGYTTNYADYQSRYLSDDGRLFFDATDALVPQDTNGKEDVYEYEPEGVGSCSPGAGSGSVAFTAARTYEVEGHKGESGAGCASLISSGESSEESAFLDASGKGPGGEEGEDVFFLTSSKLSPQDVDMADDVYDAHICSSAAPCASSAAVSPPCTTTDSCRVAPAAQPSLYGAPASATFAGAGNPVQPAARVVVKKALTRAQKLAAALKVCKRDRFKRKRITCEKQAKHKYGAVQKAEKSANANQGAHR